MIDADKKLHAPLFDRLLDDDPGENREANYGGHQLIHQLKESVRRDLENLFNSRQCSLQSLEHYDHLCGSILNYGLPDAATLNLGSGKARQEFCRIVEKAILRFEPRIRSAKVETHTGFDEEDPSIRFRVEAVLHALAAEELIVFDSALNPVTRSVTVSEARQ